MLQNFSNAKYSVKSIGDSWWNIEELWGKKPLEIPYFLFEKFSIIEKMA